MRAGALMDPDVLAVPDDLTMGDAHALVARVDHLHSYYVYVVNRDQRLVGMLDLWDLMLTPTTRVGEVMRSQVPRIAASSGRGVLMAHPGWADVHALAVVDGAGRLVGAIRHRRAW